MPLPLRSLDLPPPFRLLVLREAGDAFAHQGRTSKSAQNK